MAGCEWPVDDMCLPALPTPTDPGWMDAAAAQEAAKRAAVDILWMLSGRQFGVCPVTVRPEPAEGLWCSAAPWVLLPGPVAGIVEVTICPDIVTDWQLEGDRLYRSAGWPPQNMDLPLGSAGTWSVTFLRGLPVPEGVGKLTGMLAKELLAACSTGKCAIPSTLVSTTQRGTTHVFDQSRMLEAGKTGIGLVDQWLAAVNPHHLMQSPTVL